ncbi:MAG: AroM family protein [Rhodospirillales bacterium]|nr:AroM family protein [Rhodospirillales bacterium]
MRPTATIDEAEPSTPPPRIAFVTIGQAPRPDVVPDLVASLDPQPAYDEFGALDGLSAAAIERQAPRGREPALYTRLADGGHVVVGAGFVEDRLQKLVAELDRGGYDLIVVISTGIYRRLTATTALVHGQRALDAWIAALVLGDCRLGVIFPLPEQMLTNPAHGTLIQSASSAASTGGTRTLEEAAARLSSAELILMHSVGYTEAMARQVAAVTGRPVVTARRIIAGSIRPHAGRPHAGRPLPPADRTSSQALSLRLPAPASPLTAREEAVLAHVLDGHSNKAIGRLLGISHRTVEIHRARALDKVGATSTAELLRWSLMGAHR